MQHDRRFLFVARGGLLPVVIVDPQERPVLLEDCLDELVAPKEGTPVRRVELDSARQLPNSTALNSLGHIWCVVQDMKVLVTDELQDLDEPVTFCGRSN